MGEGEVYGEPDLAGRDPEAIARALLSLDVDTQSIIYAAWTVGLERTNTAPDLRRRMVRHKLHLSGRVAEKEVQTRLSGPASFGDKTTDELQESLQDITSVMQTLAESVKIVEDDLDTTKGMLREVHEASHQIKEKAIEVVRTAKAAELQGQRTERRLSTQNVMGSQRASVVGREMRGSVTQASLPGLSEVSTTGLQVATGSKSSNKDEGGGGAVRGVHEYDYIIIGGGVAAGYLCAELVANGLPADSLVMLSSESTLPYERTVLSKSYLHPPDARDGRMQLHDFYTTAVTGGELQDHDWYQRHGITLVLGDKGTVSELDCQEKIVITEEGQTYKYGQHLFVATGLRPLKPVDLQIPGHDVNNIFVIREEYQAAALVNRLVECEPAVSHHIVVAGGGTLGVELAAAISTWGFQVSICFPEQRLLPALFTDELGEVLENKLKAQGIQVLSSHFVTSFQQDPEDPSGAVTVYLQGPGGVDDRVELLASGVCVCVGSRANTEILTGWCEYFRNGAKVDSDLRLEAYPEVFVMGDICAYPSPQQRGKHIRVEHYNNAVLSAKHAARSAMNPDGSMPPYEFIPQFNSIILEYTDSPLGWEFYGDEHAPDVSHFEYRGGGVGGFWIANGHIAGSCLISSPPPLHEDIEKMKGIVQMRPRVTQADQEKISELGLDAFDGYVPPPEIVSVGRKE